MIPDLNSVLNKLSNPFNLLTLQEKQILKERELLVKKDIKEFSSLAKEMFDDERYKKLKDLFLDIEKNTIYLMKNLDVTKFKNKDMYLNTLLKYQIQLKILEDIFTTPEGFVQKEEAITKTK